MISRDLTEHSARALEVALYYAGRSFGVIPVCFPIDGKCNCGRHEAHLKDPKKVDDCSPGKSPHYRLHGSPANATMDASVITGWFKRERNLNIGVVAGVESGLVILDVDPKNGGDESLKEFDIPETLQVITGSGGAHYYFKHPGGDVRNSAGTIADGLDVRGHHGYVVAPPSIHPCGKEYRFATDPRAVELAECPAWILNGQATKPNTTVNTESTGAIPEGKRDDTLLRVAGKLRQCEYLDEQNIYERLIEINAKRCDPPLSDSQVRKIARSAAKYKITLRSFPHTDSGAGQMFAYLYRESFRYNHNRGGWLFFNGCRWDGAKGGPAARRHALSAARQLRDEALALGRKDRARVEQYARQLESSSRIDNTLKEARCREVIESYAEDFDRDPMLLNCSNGIVDLRTGKLRPHNPADMMTKLCPVVYDPKARLDLWDSFLDTMTEGETELQEFLQRAVGYSITGDTGEEVLFFIHGDTATGKSTFLQAILSTLGDYAMTANFATFLKNRHGDNIRVDLANMNGKRLIVSSEVDEGKSLAEGIIKSMTGGEKIRTRFLYQNEFEYQPQFSLWLAANHAPRINDADAAMWRRILRIPFENMIPEDERDPQVKQILSDPKQAGPAILGWAVEGCLAWQKDRLQVPGIVREATQELRVEMDPLADFFDEQCVIGEGLTVPVSDLRKAYDRWAQEAGIKHTINPRNFNLRLRDKGCESKPTRWNGYTCKCWRGIGLQGE